MKYPTMEWGTMEAVVNKLGGLDGVARFLRGEMEIVAKKIEEAKATVVSLLALVKTIVTPAIASKKTADCFTNTSRYYYRDSDLDNWLSKDQPEQAESKFSVQRLAQNATFKQTVESFLGTTGDIDVLTKLLKERGATTTLPAIESLIERQEAGEDVGLRTDGWANFFFVDNKDGSVSVVHAHRDVRQWLVYVHHLGLADVWDAYRRLFFRN